MRSDAARWTALRARRGGEDVICGDGTRWRLDTAEARLLYEDAQGWHRAALPEGMLRAPRDLACGIEGDGCGGGRLFVLDAGRLLAYDPMSGRTLLLCEVPDAMAVLLKAGCRIYLRSTEGTHTAMFDLSTMRYNA